MSNNKTPKPSVKRTDEFEKRDIDSLETIPQNSLKKKIGKVIISSTHLTENPQQEVLSVIFSSFFPIDIGPRHKYGPYSEFEMIGFSEHFDEIEVGTTPPRYDFILKTIQLGDLHHETRLKEVKKIEE